MEITVSNILAIVFFLAGTVGAWVIRIKAKADKAETEKLIDDKIRAAVKPIDEAIADISLNYRDQKQQYDRLNIMMTNIFDALEKNADGMEKGFEKLEKSIDKIESNNRDSLNKIETENREVFRDLWATMNKKEDRKG